MQSLGIARRGEQRMANGGYGRKRVHNLVRKDAGEFLPRLHLLAVELLVNIADRDNPQILPVELHRRAAQHQVLVANLGRKVRCKLLAGLYAEH